jgi:hypothetical protein
LKRIHLNPDESSPSSVDGLPLFLERKFRTWRYSVSHSELRLRSVGSDSERDFIEVTFYGVVGVKLKTVYRPLVITAATSEQRDEMLEFSCLPESQTSRILCLALKADSGDGFVACLRYSVWLHPKELEQGRSGGSHSGSRLILRG